MEVLTSEITVENIEIGPLKDVYQSTVLWVIHADKVPPHIGISTSGSFYSLKATGKDIGMPVDQLLKLIDRKKITTICYVLGDLLKELNLIEIFDHYDKTIPRKITCLAPVKNVLSIDHANKLSELLRILRDKKKIARVIGFHSENFSGIKDYDLEQIHERLEELVNE